MDVDKLATMCVCGVGCAIKAYDVEALRPYVACVKKCIAQTIRWVSKDRLLAFLILALSSSSVLVTNEFGAIGS